MKKFSAIFLILAVVSCKTDQSKSNIKHTLGDVSWSEGRWTYLELSRAEFVTLTPSNYLPEDHPLTRQGQQWAQRIHAAVTEKYPSKMEGVPAPSVIILKKSSPDAFAAMKRTVGYSMKTGLFVTGPDNHEPPVETSTLYMNHDQELARNIFPVQINRVVDDPESYQRWFRKKFEPCDVVPVSRGDVKWSYGSGCKKVSYLKTNQWSAAFATQVAPNWIIVSSGLFSTMPSEESFVAVIAHELAHYYRAHVVNNMSAVYSNCYLLSDPRQKPVDTPELKTICRNLIADHSEAGQSAEVAAAQAGLGIYTYEQEADELALEFLTLVDISPKTAIDAWFALFASSQTGEDGREFSVETCRELLQRGWRDSEGRPVSVPIGDYRSPHKSWCYRIFNTTREIEWHGYDISQPARSDIRDWEWFRNIAKSL